MGLVKLEQTRSC